MRILLIYPRPEYSRLPDSYWMPLGFSFMAAKLMQKGHEVSIFDRNSLQARLGLEQKGLDDAMVEQVKIWQPDLIGFNTVSPLIYDTVRCVRIIRQFYDGMVIAGGHHATALPELTLQKIPGLDGLIAGEGEYAIARLAEGENPEDIPGVWWRNGVSGPVHKAPQPIAHLDELPFPAIDLLDLEIYLRPTTEILRGPFLRTASVLSSRGCERRCGFCSESLTYGRGIRFHSAEYTLEWMAWLQRDFLVQGIYFHDNNFLIDPDRARAICAGLVKRGLHRQLQWGIQARADSLEPALLRELKRAGCTLIEVGIESSRQSDLDLFNKGISVALNQRAIELCHQAGIGIHVNMISGLEGESISELEEKLAWVVNHQPESFQFYPLKIHPATAFYKIYGQDFFARSSWEESEIQRYYQESQPSNLDFGIKDSWMKNQAGQKAAYFRRRNIWRKNSLPRLICWLKHKAELKMRIQN